MQSALITHICMINADRMINDKGGGGVDRSPQGYSGQVGDDARGDGPAGDDAPRRWFLTAQERGNPDTDLDRGAAGGAGEAGESWSAGNLVRPLVHGAHYFQRLYEELCALRPGDRLYFTDWRGDADEQLTADGHRIGDVLRDLARSGVEVRGLVWRSHSERMRFNAQANRRLGAELNEAGGEVLLDQRVRRFGSHHQKLFVVQHRGEPARDVAFAGGIDLCHGRRDDAAHAGDPQRPVMDRRYGRRPPWHDAHARAARPRRRRPAARRSSSAGTTRTRWIDARRTTAWSSAWRTCRVTRSRCPRRSPRHLPRAGTPSRCCGPTPRSGRRTRSPREGERSIARAYGKAFSRAHSFIYVEDQYLWDEQVARSIAEALRRSPGLRVVAVLPRYPDADGRVNGPPVRLGQKRALDLLRGAAPDRVLAVDLETEAGVPVYVHAKVCIVDDVWFTCGSDNFNLRSWTNDSEITCAVVDGTRDDREPADLSGVGDGARVLARELRLQLWAEHLGLDPADPRLLDPGQAWELWLERSRALDAWHAGGRRGPRPAGRVRHHDPEPLTTAQQRWTPPFYRLLVDPDGRPRRLRRAESF